MATLGNFKSGLLRATAATGILAASATIHTAAHAVNFVSGTFTGAGPASTNPQLCRVSATVTLTGTTNDGFGRDNYATGLIDVNTKQIITGYNGFSVDDSMTATTPTFHQFSPNLPRGDYALGIFERGSSITPLGVLVGEIPLQRSGFYNSGNCEGVLESSVVADAGTDLAVNSGDSAQLDGTGTNDPDGDPLTYNWSQVNGPFNLQLSNSNTSQPSFTAPLVTTPTTWVFRLTASDPLGIAETDLVSVTISPPPNTPPTVNAGPDQGVSGGDAVTLAGTASDQDNDPLTTTWVQTAGTNVTLSDPNALNPTFTAPARARDDQTLTFELRADDGTVVSTDTVDIVVAGNEAPNVVATASPTSGAGNSQFTLDGSGTTDPEGDPLIYIWTQTAGPNVTIDSPNSAVTTFTAPPGGIGTNQTLTFQLTAVDTFDESDSETVSVTLLANQGPTADAGSDQDVLGTSTVTLDGSGSSDPDNDPLSYSWTQISGPTVTLSDASIVNPTFLAPAAKGQDQLIEFELEVQDRDVNGGPISARLVAGTGVDTDRVVIRVLANRPPVADAGADQGPIDAGQTVTLDGSGSTDPDGDTLTYSWVQTGGPAVTLSDPTAAQPTFVAPQANDTVTFELTVSDGTVTATDSVSVEVRAIGTITIVQNITGSDTQVSFTSNLAALQTSVTTSGGTAQVSAQSVPTGTYTVTAADLLAQGIAVTDIACSDDDSTGDVGSRTATINLAAGEDVTCTFTAANSREAAQVAIYNFLTGRNALILANQPDLQRRIDRLTPGGGAGGGSVNAYGINVPFSDRLPVQASIAEGQARFRSDLGMALGGKGDRLFDLWGEAVFSSATIGTQEASFSIISVGADIKLGEDVLIGALAQFDEISDEGSLEAGEAEGDGYLIGPYLTARLADGFFVEARAAWGSSDNVVSPLAGQRDAFETDRSLYSGSLIGQLALGKKTTLRPELTVRYLSEDQQAYTDSLGIAIPAQTVDQGDVSFRPRISHVIDAGGFSLRPYAQAEGIYTFGTAPDAALANLLPGNFADTFGDVRARIEGGVDLLGEGSFRATLSGFADGIGADGFSNEGVRLGVSFGF